MLAGKYWQHKITILHHWIVQYTCGQVDYIIATSIYGFLVIVNLNAGTGSTEKSTFFALVEETDKEGSRYNNRLIY